MLLSSLLLGLLLQAENADHGVGPTAAGQQVSDSIREKTDADIAFMPAGMLAVESGKSLSSYLMSPNEQVVIITLSGDQVKNALERAISVYPSSNPGFLQVSGLEIAYKPGGSASRIVSVDTASGKLNITAKYDVAMPVSLAKGAFGYFTIWDSNTPTKRSEFTLSQATSEQVISASQPRWRQVK